MTDEQLLADFLVRSRRVGLRGLVRRYGPMVLRVCRDVLGDPEDAEDAFQATFLVLLRQAGSIRDRASIGRWLYEVACRISRRERRRVAGSGPRKGRLWRWTRRPPPTSTRRIAS